MKKIFLLMVMMTLASIFVSCGAESTSGEEELTPVKLSERVGTYKFTADAKNSVEIELAAKNDGTGTIIITIVADGTETASSTITVTEAEMDSTESSFTEGSGDAKVTLAFVSATDKDSNITITIREANPIVATLVKQ